MRAAWSARRFLVLGALFLVAGVAVYAWESLGGADIELLEVPLLLVGALFLLEGYVARRRERIASTNNPK